MSDKKDGGPAFPFPAFIREKDQWDVYEHQASRGGMSLRDWFAGQALAGMMSGRQLSDLGSREEWFAVVAYVYADAMLAARDAKEGGQDE